LFFLSLCTGNIKEERYEKGPNPFCIKLSITGGNEMSVDKAFQTIEEKMKTKQDRMVRSDKMSVKKSYLYFDTFKIINIYH
jgi:hypothetical protein